MEHFSVKKNFLYQMVYQILIILLPFITSPYIARVLGAEGLGTYSYSYSIAYYFVLFSMLGLANYGNRAIAQCWDKQEKMNETFSSIVCIHIFISLICFLIYICYVYVLSDGQLYAIIQGAYVLSALFDISWFYFGTGKFKITVTRNTIIKILTVIFVFTFVKKESDLWIYCVIMSFSTLFSQVVLWIPLKKYVTLTKPTITNMLVHVKPMLLLFIPAIAISLYKYMDKIMIGVMSTKTQLGFYENAEKVINIPMTIIASFGVVMLPKMSNLAAVSDKNIASKIITVSMQYIMCLAFALSFGLAGVGRVFAPIFWGSEFGMSGIIIMGLAITIPFVAFSNVIRTQYLIPYSRDKVYLVSVIIGALVNLVMNFFLIPKGGALGATIATIVVEIVVCVSQSFLISNELPLRCYIKAVVPFFFFGLLMFIGVYIVGEREKISVITLFFQVLVGSIFYGIMCTAYFYRTKNEVFMNILSMVKKKLRHSKIDKI